MATGRRLYTYEVTVEQPIIVGTRTIAAMVNKVVTVYNCPSSKTARRAVVVGAGGRIVKVCRIT